MNDAGRVMILPKGKYSATVQYDKLDSVTYNGSAWVATQSTIGNEPADDSDYWILFVKGGGVTADGTSLEMDADGVLGIKDGVIPDVDGSTIVKDDNNIIRIADALKKLIDGAVQEVAGKGLSTNDFTDTLLQKLNGIAEGANNYSLPDATSSIKGGVILSNSEAVTDSTGMALPATEKNASLEGTLANKISELNSNLMSDFKDIITNLNTTTCRIGLVNGWDNSTVGMPSDFNMYGTFIQVFNWSTYRQSFRKQILIGQNAQIWAREYNADSNTFTNWVSSLDNVNSSLGTKLNGSFIAFSELLSNLGLQPGCSIFSFFNARPSGSIYFGSFTGEYLENSTSNVYNIYLCFKVMTNFGKIFVMPTNSDTIYLADYQRGSTWTKLH